MTVKHLDFWMFRKKITACMVILNNIPSCQLRNPINPAAKCSDFIIKYCFLFCVH